jgi:hypothetical protein
MSIVLIDTSVFCNILDIPAYNQNRDTVMADLEAFIRYGDTLLLPLATIIETGNHISQLSDGQHRRQTAKRFCQMVIDAIDGKAPWSAMRFWESEQLKTWLAEFPDYAMRQLGIADLSIIKDWESICEVLSNRRVRIWSLDTDLSSRDRNPFSKQKVKK